MQTVVQQPVAPKTGSRTPLAVWARALEILIPAYMLGKSWGIAESHNLELFKAMLPAKLVELSESMKTLFHTDSVEIGRLISTSCGALIGFACMMALAVVLHEIMRDRRFVDSLRFTSVTAIPLSALNGLLSHGLQTLMDNTTILTEASLKVNLVYMPWAYFAVNVAFYLVALWVMGRRTGVAVGKRRVLLLVGVLVVGAYLTVGLMITPNEWAPLCKTLLSGNGGM